MDFKKLKMKKTWALGVGLITLFTVSYASMQWQTSRLNRLQTLSSGLQTCFNRVTQSFTAMMTQSMQADYLQDQFSQMTNECFQEAAKMANTVLNKADHKMILLKVNRLQSDVHWFLERLEKSERLSDSSMLGMESSNIPSKYTDLEELKMESMDLIDTAIQRRNKLSSASMIAGAVFLVLIIGLGVYMVYRARKEKKVFEDINMKAKAYMMEDNDVQLAHLDRLLERVCKLSNTENLYEIFSRYNEGVTDRLYSSREDTTVLEGTGTNFDKVIEKGPVVNLDRAFTTILKGIQKKAFTHGVLIDADFDDEINVSGSQDVFDQIVYNAMNYAIDSSMLHNKGRRIVLRSKTLADTVYLTMFVSNHYLSVSELEALNEREDSESSETMPVALEVMNALVSDIDVKLTVRNKVDQEGNLTGCEFEFLFKAVDTFVAPKKSESSSKLVSIVKGTKKDLLKNFGVDV